MKSWKQRLVIFAVAAAYQSIAFGSGIYRMHPMKTIFLSTLVRKDMDHLKSRIKACRKELRKLSGRSGAGKKRREMVVYMQKERRRLNKLSHDPKYAMDLIHRFSYMSMVPSHGLGVLTCFKLMRVDGRTTGQAEIVLPLGQRVPNGAVWITGVNFRNASTDWERITYRVSWIMQAYGVKKFKFGAADGNTEVKLRPVQIINDIPPKKH